MVIVLLFISDSYGQQPASTIRGTVTENGSNKPLAYVTVILQDSNLGTTTDSITWIGIVKFCIL